MDSGKKSFLWLIAIFVAPILLGTLLFFNLDRIGIKKGSVNYGTLIQPAFPAKVIDLKVENKPAKRNEVLSKKWTMLYIETDKCDQFCQDRLLLMKRIRLLMNEQMRRVRVVLVANKNTLDSINKKIYHDIIIAHVDVANSDFVKQFPGLENKPIYLLDPLGNLMMYYPQPNPNAKKMIKDLQKLLKYSRLG